MPAEVPRAESEAVTLLRYGRPAAVVLSPARYEQLLVPYRIEVRPAAARQLRKLDPQTARRIEGVIALLADDQDRRPHGG